MLVPLGVCVVVEWMSEATMQRHRHAALSVKALLLVALYMLVQCTITTTAGADPVHKGPDQLTVFILPHSHDDVGT